MKTLIRRILPMLCASGLLLTAAAQTAPEGTVDDTNAPVMPDQPADASDQVAAVPAPGDAAQTPAPDTTGTPDTQAANAGTPPEQDQSTPGRFRLRMGRGQAAAIPKSTA
jgi:hypothetical protein